MWQEAQAGVVACAFKRSRTVRRFGFVVSLTMEKSTVAGGAGVRDLYTLREGRPVMRAPLTARLAGRLGPAAG